MAVRVATGLIKARRRAWRGREKQEIEGHSVRCEVQYGGVEISRMVREQLPISKIAHDKKIIHAQTGKNDASPIEY